MLGGKYEQVSVKFKDDDAMASRDDAEDVAEAATETDSDALQDDASVVAGQRRGDELLHRLNGLRFGWSTDLLAAESLEQGAPV